MSKYQTTVIQSELINSQEPLIIYPDDRGSGKMVNSILMLMSRTNCPNFVGVIAAPAIDIMEKKVMPTLASILEHNKDVVKYNKWGVRFRSGACIDLVLGDSEMETIHSTAGREITTLIMVEVDQFALGSINYLRTRMRSRSKYQPQMVFTLNTDRIATPSTYLTSIIGPYLNQEGRLDYEYFDKYDRFFAVDRFGGHFLTANLKDPRLEGSYYPQKVKIICSRVGDNYFLKGVRHV